MNNPVALITGARRGIGYGIAEILTKNRYDIVFNGISSAEKTTAQIKNLEIGNTKILYVQADISLNEDRIKLIEMTRKKFSRLDLLVNNAGIAPEKRVDLLEAGEESFDRVISTNLKGPYFLTQLAARWMIEQKEKDSSRHPKIINISSISAYTSSPSRGEYCVSKAGVSMMTKLFADRLAEFDIPVYEIQPGITKTDMTASVQAKYDKMIGDGLLPFKRWGTPEDVAKAVLAIAQDLLPYSTGEVINVDGGFHLRRL